MCNLKRVGLESAGVRPTAKSKPLLPFALCAIFVLSSFAVVRPASSTTPSQPNTPTLNQITLVDYNGSDASGVSDLRANKIDAYDSALTPSAASSLPSSYHQYMVPSSLYGLYVNPQNTSAGSTHNFNPFYFQSVRFALNYVVNRNYFGQTILGGNFIPCISAVCAEPDSTAVAAGVAPFSNVTYDLSFANATIYKTLTANGVTYTNHQYSYGGKPVTVGLFDRTDDPIRHAFVKYLDTQLQNLGFATTLITGTLSVAESVVFGSDPVNATWDIYPASDGQIWGYYDSNAENFYSAGYYNDLPASDSDGANWVGGWDNNTQEPYSTTLYDDADNYAIPLLISSFGSMAQRNELLSNLTYYGVLGATYITLGTSLAPYATTGAVSDVTPNFLTDPFGNYQDYMTMSTSSSDASGTVNQLTMGVRHIADGAVNPVGGDNDEYSDSMQQAGALPLYGYGPSTGYYYSTAMKFKVNANTNQSDNPVPSSAIWFNGTSDRWQNVTSGATAQDDVTVNVADYLSHTAWADGQPVTLADMLWQYIEMQSVLAPGSPIYDNGSERAIYSVESSQVVGFRVLNSTSVEVYATGTFFQDATWAAYGVIGDVLSPLGYSGYTDGLGMTPWQVYYAMNQMVAAREAVWSIATATANTLDWLNLLNPTDVGNVKAALSAAGSTIPPELAQLQSMTGQSWVNASTASAGYTAAVNFINTNGVAVISDGPFYISQYSSSSSPAFLVMKRNPLFSAGSQADPALFAPPVLLSPQATIPPVVNPGSFLTVTTVQMPDGDPTQSSPASGATVAYIFLSQGTVVYSNSTTTGSNGQATLAVPSTMEAGPYILDILVSSPTATLINPLVTSVVIGSAAVTSSSVTLSSSVSQSSSASTTSTTSSSGTNYIYYVASAVVVVVILIAVAATFVRRRK
jgi:peptide/nickel transport system substrate-binding protein